MLPKIGKYLRGGLIACVLYVGLCTSIAAGTFNVTIQTPFSKIPQGTTAPIMWFQVTNIGDAEEISEIFVRNTASQVFFGKKISRAFIFQDDDNAGPGSFNSGNNTLLSTQDFTGQNQGDVRFVLTTRPQLTTENNTVSFFVAYEIDDDATIEASTNITLVDIKDGDAQFADLDSVSASTFNSIVISGVSTMEVDDIAPTVVVPGQEKVEMLKIRTKIDGEIMDDDVQFRVINEAGADGIGFSTTTGNENGIIRAYLYEDLQTVGTFGVFDTTDRLLQTLRQQDFTSSSEITFQQPFIGDSNFAFADGQERQFFVVFDIGEDFEVSVDTKINAQLVSFSGTGRDSGLTIRSIDQLPKPSDPSEAFVAGLAISELNAIDNGDSTFGPGDVAPILSFKLLAHQTAVTLNQVFVQNTGAVDFITSSGTNGITRVRLFEDTGNGAFDGIDGADNLISDKTLGQGDNQADTAILNINSGGLNIDPFIESEIVLYPNDNSKVLFVVYDIGTTTGTGESAQAQILNAVGSANVESEIITMNLKGALPVTANPDATIDVVETSAVLSSITDISPTFGFQGQIKIPMLDVFLNSDVENTNGTITILNETQTFLTNSKGVSKVWVYKDGNDELSIAPNNIYDDNDKFQSSFRVGSDEHSVSEITLDNLNISDGENRFFVLYDLGQNASRPISQSTASNNIRAQVNGMGNNDGDTITLGGVLPAPTLAASLTPMVNKINVLSISAPQVGDTSDVRVSFNVSMSLKNNSNEDIGVTEFFPRVFLSGIFGNEITSEFNVSTLQSFPVTVNAGQSLSITYVMRHTNVLSQGTATLDGYTEFRTAGGDLGVATRYQGDNGVWFAAADSVDQIPLINSTDRQYSFSLPSYIDEIKVGTSFSSGIPFQKGDAISNNLNMYIKLSNNGSNIDEDSIAVRLNGTQIRRSEFGASASETFSYDSENGIIVITNLGSANGSVQLELTDTEGIAQETTNLSFIISQATVRMTDVLFHPNPFNPGGSDSLQLGFNLTTTATVRVYFFNHLGSQSGTIIESSFVGPGYKLLNIDTSGLSSGMYIVRVEAVDTDGNESIQITKLAIY
jgi:hypothetical protein